VLDRLQLGWASALPASVTPHPLRAESLANRLQICLVTQVEFVFRDG
jgi:hypothetical protein